MVDLFCIRCSMHQTMSGRAHQFDRSSFSILRSFSPDLAGGVNHLLRIKVVRMSLVRTYSALHNDLQVAEFRGVI